MDQGSTNGTYIGSLRVREVVLHSGCEVTIGKTRIEFAPLTTDIEVSPSEGSQFGPLIGASTEMRSVYTLISKVAPSDLSVVIQGATGTGKELVAQAIHQYSRRDKKPLVVFDCSAVPEHLIESELFGHEKGSFSGALRTHKGVFEQAEGGTLFLDELGELSLKLQPKLLRALESGMIRRVGGERMVRVDVRIISATNRNLHEMVEAKTFRQDLFYRLAKVQVQLPPLSKRGDDVHLIAHHFIERLNQQNKGFRFIQGIDKVALGLMKKWNWPGNVRELRNVIERAYTFADHPWIQDQDLSLHIQELQETADEQGFSPLDFQIPESCSLKEAKERMISSFEKEYLNQLMEKHQMNISKMAREAGIDRRHIYRLFKKYNIELSQYRN